MRHLFAFAAPRFLIAAAALVLLTSPVALADVCVVPDNGGGTVDLPPAGCNGYVSPQDLHIMIDGLPPGTTIRVDPNHNEFFNQGVAPDPAVPGGEIETFDSLLCMQMQGTGALSGFARSLCVPLAAEVHSAPRTAGDPVQTFATEMVSLNGEIFGDPDFDLLRVQGGQAFGLPSPGQTTLTQLPSGNFNVDSFFDITYRIEFQGAPGSVLAGMGGTTTDTVRMGMGEPAVPPDPCTSPDDSTGTAVLPPPGCAYLSPSDFHIAVSNTDPNTTLIIDASHNRFLNIQKEPGGSLGGNIETFDSNVDLQITGTGALTGFSRTLSVPLDGEAHSGPRGSGDSQMFPNEMVQLQGEIFGDPDFDLFRIRAGSGFGLPSPGHTTLTRLGNGNWNVDSFFDITYTIDFQGAPGSVLDGQNGSSTGTVRMSSGGPPGQNCPPIPPGSDVFPSTATLVLQPTGQSPFVVRLSSAGLADAVVQRGTHDQGQRTVQTEMLSMSLSGSHPRLGGDVIVSLTPGTQSLGQLTHVEQDPDTCELLSADSFFDVIVDVELPGLNTTLSCDRPLRLQAPLTGLPPGTPAIYENPFLDPINMIDQATSTVWGQILYERHHANPPFPPPGNHCFDTTFEADLDLAPLGLGQFPVQGGGVTTVLRTPLPQIQGTCSISGTSCFNSSDCPQGEACLPASNPGISTEITQADLFGAPVFGGMACQPSGQPCVNNIDCPPGETCAPSGTPVEVRIGRDRGLPPSSGQVVSQQPSSTYPADSFFDVFFEVELPEFNPPMILHNQQPLNIGSSGQDGIRNIPVDPGSVFQQDAAQPPTELFDDQGQLRGFIHNVRHGIQPPFDWAPPPPPEDYCFDSWIHLRITIYNPFCEAEVWLPGTFRVLRGDVSALGAQIMKTLMAKADFLGSTLCTGPLSVLLDPNASSEGEVEGLTPEEFFPASSFFDMNIQIDTGIGVLTPSGPIQMANMIRNLPPDDGEIYFAPGTIIPINDPTGVPVGEILEVSHVVHRTIDCPPDHLSRIVMSHSTDPASEGVAASTIFITPALDGAGGGILYDVVGGSFGPGGFDASTVGSAGCLLNNGTGSIVDPAPDPGLGSGRFYIARELFDTFVGSWDAGGESTSRDPLLAPVCP